MQIILIQDFYNYNPGQAKPGHPIKADYGVIIDEGNTYCFNTSGRPCNILQRVTDLKNHYQRIFCYTICSFLIFQTMAEGFRLVQPILTFWSYRFCGLVDVWRSEALRRGKVNRWCFNWPNFEYIASWQWKDSPQHPVFNANLKQIETLIAERWTNIYGIHLIFFLKYDYRL